MPISLPVGLPAGQTLAAEGIEVFDLQARSVRPLRICLVNLMPNKLATETQICRLLGAAAIPVAVTLCVPDSYRSKTAPPGHLAAFYRRWSQLRHEPFDGLVVTGAPIETLPFEDVTYWADLLAMMAWAKSRIAGAFYICWAAQAALYHFYRVPKHPLPAKIFGVFPQQVAGASSPLLRGFGATFPTPISRYTEVRADDLPRPAGLDVLARSPDTGLCLIDDPANRAVHMFNHLEYDTETLHAEFLRDRSAGKAIDIPAHYFPGDDPARPPVNTWRPHARLLFANWLDEIRRTAWAEDAGRRSCASAH